MKDTQIEYIFQKADSLRNILIENRRDLYMNPELSGKEERNSKIITEKLKKIG